MRIKTILFAVFSVLAFTFLFSSCQTEGCTNSKATNFDQNATQDDGSCQFENGITLKVSVLENDEPIVWKEKTYTNNAGNEYVPERLQFYLSDIKVYYAQLEELLIADFHYFDAIDAESFSVSRADISKGKIDSISFVFGLRGALNVDYALPNIINNINMQWPTPMGGGYHYMKFEGKYNHSDNSQHSFNVHLGRLINNDGTTDPSFKVSFPITDLEIADMPVVINIGMDMNRWFDGDTDYDMESFGEGIMGNHQAQALLRANGKNDVFKYIESWTEYLQ